MIRVFALPSHAVKNRTSGVDFARIIQPMRSLGKEKGFKVTIHDVNEPKHSEWPEICQNHDIIYFNYTVNDWAFAVMGTMARKYGTKLVMDLDDALWDILPDNEAYNVYKKGSRGETVINAIINECDYITCTHGYLKNIIISHTHKYDHQIRVFPNLIDLDLYSHRTKPKNDHLVTVGHFGSSTHYISLQTKEFVKGMNRLMAEYPNVEFLTIGAFIPDFRAKWGQRYRNSFGDQDIYKWIENKYPSFMDEIDFMAIPLADNVYNKGKSYIKWLEVSASKRSGVWQDIRQYQEVINEGKNGLLAKTADEWYSQMKKLVDDPKLRRRMGIQSFKDVQAHQVSGKEYAKFFREIVD